MQRKQNNDLPFSYRVIALALFALCLLLLLWVAGHVHPDFATAASPAQSAPGASGTASSTGRRLSCAGRTACPLPPST